MRIGLIAPPFIPVPPKEYGGTELFVGHLAVGLQARGVDVVVYANGESNLPVEVRWLYEKSEWPIKGEVFESYKDINHSAWAARDASESCDLIHMNGAAGLAHSRFLRQPVVYTVHHADEPGLREYYHYYPNVHFACISEFQRRRQQVPNSCTIYHGIDASLYRYEDKKQDYLCFLGRIAPVKGTHLAIEVAKKAGIPLKIAGQIQPMFKGYFESKILPHVDGKFIEFLGEADLAAKNELLSHARAMLFPIQWQEPFGLVMVEAMACGTPVLALPGGSVPEVVREGVSGFVCRSLEEMANRAKSVAIPAQIIREYVEKEFSLDTMADNYLRLYEEVIQASRETSAPESAVA